MLKVRSKPCGEERSTTVTPKVHPMGGLYSPHLHKSCPAGSHCGVSYPRSSVLCPVRSCCSCAPTYKCCIKCVSSCLYVNPCSAVGAERCHWHGHKRSSPGSSGIAKQAAGKVLCKDHLHPLVLPQEEDAAGKRCRLGMLRQGSAFRRA